MDETIAKREARRRRILENSERRLQKIIGRTEQTESEDSNYTNSITKSNDIDLGANGIIITKHFAEEECNGLRYDDNSIKSRQILNKENICSSELNTSNIYADVLTDIYGITNKRSNINTPDNDDETTQYLQEESSINYHSKNDLYTKTILPYNLLSSHISYVLLAVIANILLMCKLDHWYGKTIIIPYFVMALGRLCTTTNFQEPRHGSPLIAALILCNIKPELTYRLRAGMSLFIAVVTDLALYIFSFTLIYHAIVYYLQDFNILIASSI